MASVIFGPVFLRSDEQGGSDENTQTPLKTITSKDDKNHIYLFQSKYRVFMISHRQKSSANSQHICFKTGA